MAVADLVEMGSDAWVARQLLAGRSDAEIVQALRLRVNDTDPANPLMAPQSYWAAVERGKRQLEQAGEFEFGGLDYRRKASEYQSPIGGGNAYQYVADVTFRDPATGLETRRTFRQTSGTSLTRREVLDLIAQDIEQAGGPLPQRKTPTGIDPQMEVVMIDFVAVGRGFM